MSVTNPFSWVLAASLALSAGGGFGQEPAPPPAPAAGDHAEAMWEGEWQLVQVVSVDDAADRKRFFDSFDLVSKRSRK